MFKFYISGEIAALRNDGDVLFKWGIQQRRTNQGEAEFL